MESPLFVPRAVGFVRTPFKHTSEIPKGLGAKHEANGALEILPEFEAGLTDIEGFSHLIVLWVFHQSEGYELLGAPPGEPFQHGVFATRSPRRPNPIALTIVRLERREGRLLHVHGVDMLDGSPILDIKPYLSGVDPKLLRRGWNEEAEKRRDGSVEAAAPQLQDRAKDEFLMTLSHELRTPMTAILGWSRLLPTMDSDEPIFREAVASIARSAELQAQLIDDVLDVSRIVSGKLRLAPEVVDVDSMVREAADGVRIMADARSVEITTSLAADAGKIYGDPTRLQQVLWNLLSNAVKFTPAEGRVEISARRNGADVEISVSDSGEGIDPEFLPHIFEPFRQGENPRTRVHGGLGLGLSIVRHLVEAHGGSVQADSAGRGQGATFRVTLPVNSHGPVAASREPEQTSQTVEAINPKRLSGVRILVIDDDRETRSFLQAVLLHAGADVTAVESGTAALHHLETHKPDMIVTDLAMPGTDGYELARIVRADHRNADVKIVALSAFPAASNAPEQSRFDARLFKPIEPVDLIEALARIGAG